VKWCGQVFSTVSTATVLVELFADTLLLLDPSLNMCIDRALKEHDEPLALLLELQQSTQQFASNFQAAVEAVSHGRSNSQFGENRQLRRHLFSLFTALPSGTCQSNRDPFLLFLLSNNL